MPTEILGLPLHPLSVHLPIVLVPFLALIAAGYVLVPRIRPQTGWLLVALSVVTVGAAFVSRWSGQELAQQRLGELAASPDVAADVDAAIAHHSQYGDVLIWLVLAIVPVAFLFSGIVSGRLAGFATRRSWTGLSAWSKPPSASGSGTNSRQLVVILLGVLLLALAAASVFFVIRAGHTGAEMIWGG